MKLCVKDSIKKIPDSRIKSRSNLEIIHSNSPASTPLVGKHSTKKSTRKTPCLTPKRESTPFISSVKLCVKDSIKKIPDSRKKSGSRRRSIKRLQFSRSPENKKRVRLCIPEKSPLSICDELIDLEQIETPETTRELSWLPELNLSLGDKRIITDNGWLSDKHMLAVSNILRRQFPHINGLQDTQNTPFFMEDNQLWNTSRHFKPQISPCDGNNHWTMSFSTSKDPNFIYYIDSLGANLKSLRNNIKIHLSQIYRSSSSILEVKVPRVQQQPNSYDCGLFSIANVVEFCFKPDCFNTRVTYSTSKMREHLIQCLESGNMTPFPKEAVRGRCKLDSVTCKVFKIPIWCICKMPECIDNMICCDNRKCRTWFHRKCLNIDSQRNEWQCPSCEIQND